MLKRRESGPSKPLTQEEIQERVRKVRIRLCVLQDVLDSHQVASAPGELPTILDCIETIQAAIWQRQHIIDARRVTPEGAIRIEKEIGKMQEQKMILDDILPKGESAKEALTDMEEEIARLEKTLE